MKRKIRVRFTTAALAVVAALVLSGCTSDPLAQQYLAGSGKGYIAGDGRITEYAQPQRGRPVEFTGTLTDGSTVTSGDYVGEVLVVNFWYAACPPCRSEAPDLEAIYKEFEAQGVKFLGVNIRDSDAAQALAFERTYGITYPSTIDANDASMQLAFSGTVAPNAVPTTLVLDKEGRVASRVLGRIPDASVLRALVTAVLAEPAP